jgi:hypothetical protein
LVLVSVAHAWAAYSLVHQSSSLMFVGGSSVCRCSPSHSSGL